MKKQLWLVSFLTLLIAHTHAATPEAWTEHFIGEADSIRVASPSE